MICLDETTLKVATQDDAPALVALVNQAYRPASGKRGWTDEVEWVAGERINQEQMCALLADNATVLTLWNDQRLLACVHVQEAHTSTSPKSGTCESGESTPSAQRSAYIGMLATLPEYQGSGLGKRMLALAEQYAVTHLSATAFKMTVLVTRSELLAFYERRGYRRTGQRDDYPLSAGVGQPLHDGLQLEILVKATLLPTTIVPARFPQEFPEVTAIFREYVLSPKVSLDFQNYETEFADLPGKYAEPQGQILLAWQGESPVGCAALRPLDKARCELKRVYVRPAARGLGVGRRLVESMIDKARSEGYLKMYLDVLPEFAAAQQLYADLGFIPDEAVSFNSVPGTQFLSLALSSYEHEG